MSYEILIKTKPETWTEWLWFAMKAEEVLIDRGMNEFQAEEYLKNQDPDKIVNFIREYVSFHAQFTGYGDSQIVWNTLSPVGFGNTWTSKKPDQDNIVIRKSKGGANNAFRL